MFVKDRCVAKGACNTYSSSTSATLTLADCQTLVDGSGALCTWLSGTPTTCSARTCTDNTTATDLATCTSYLSSCAKKTSGAGCEAVTCANATATSEATC